MTIRHPWRKLFILISIVILIMLAIPVSFLLIQYAHDEQLTVTDRPGYVNDQGHLNLTTDIPHL